MSFFSARYYEFDDYPGEKFESVTTVLQAVSKGEGFYKWLEAQGTAKVLKVLNEAKEKEPELYDRLIKYVPEEMLKTASDQSKEAADIGTEVHKAIHKALKGEDYGALSPPAEKAFDAFRHSFDDEDVETVATEATVVAPKLHYAGTIDFVGRSNKTGKLRLYDWKTSKKNSAFPYPQIKMQLAGYWKAALNTFGGADKWDQWVVMRLDKFTGEAFCTRILKPEWAWWLRGFSSAHDLWKTLNTKNPYRPDKPRKRYRRGHEPAMYETK